MLSGFDSKEQYIDAVSRGFSSLKNFQKATGFTLFSDYKRRMESGFPTKLLWDQANAKGFETRDEYNLAIKEKLHDKKELVIKFTKTVEDLKSELSLIEDEVNSFQKLISSEYSKQKLTEYKTQLLEKKKDLEEKVEIHEKLKVIVDDDFSLLLVIVEHKRTQLLEKSTKLLSWIETRFPFLDKWNKVIKVINNFRSHVPVQLDRIAELSELSENDTEPLLIEMAIEMPSLGEYLQLEQVFIKKTKTKDELANIIEEMRKKQLQAESDILETNCLYCGCKMEIDTEKPIAKCPNCSKLIPICPICRGLLFERDEILIEENCGNLFHKRHIIEWVNVQRNCPVCRTKVNEKSLVKFEIE